MSNIERKTPNAEIQRVVQAINYSSDEILLIEMTKTWNAADFLYAIERLQVDQPKDRRDPLLDLYRNLRRERADVDARLAAEVSSAKRHADLVLRLDEIKKPHWTLAPNFWIGTVILAVSVLAVFVAIWTAWHH
ncbi:MAG TPA: hypothetical protein VGO67_16380 [Verrucomicrobiae bacterium]